MAELEPGSQARIIRTPCGGHPCGGPVAARRSGMNCFHWAGHRRGGRGDLHLPFSFPSSVPVGPEEAEVCSLSVWLLAPPPPSLQFAPPIRSAQSKPPFPDSGHLGCPRVVLRRDLGHRSCMQVRECGWITTLCPFTTDSLSGRCHCHHSCAYF